ncbi:hypothetical protein QN277_007401 [Acacia crassicarpa]|uniref:Uncharacterized protein n=1 Tax=Acacia crassicarpa TaxID=499986 RepID=A0AAE1JRC6_9FABA|nr:hypothetical protein QN277_007401 [Acacia crassicarpa]
MSASRLGILVMDGAAGYLGIKAEIEQNKVKHLRLWIFECREPSLEAFLLGLGAVALSAIAHVIANLLGGCNCIFSQQEFAKAPPNTQLSVACLILTWDQDCDGCWNVHADDMGFVKQKFKGFVWYLTPSFSVHWRGCVLCSCLVLCSLLLFCKCLTGNTSGVLYPVCF